MYKKILASSVLILANLSIGQAMAGDFGNTKAEAIKNTSLAKQWMAGTLKSYGGAKVSYTGKPFTMKSTHHIPPVSGLAKIHIKAFKILEKMSNGKIKVNHTWSKTVHGPREGRKAVRTGLSDYAPCFPAYNAKDYKMAHGLGLPFIFRNAHEATAVAEHLYSKYLKKEQERFKGVKVARASMTGSYHLYTKKPVKKLEDLKGMKLRAGGGPHAKILGALGATQVSMPAASAYTALQRGTLDGYHINDPVALIFKAQEVTKYRTENGFNVFPVFYCVAGKFYDGLPGDLQVVFNNWSRQFAQIEAQAFYDGFGAIALDKMVNKGGIKLLSLPEAELNRWKSAVAPVTSAWVKSVEKKGLPGLQFIADVKKLVKKYKAMTPNQILQEAIDTPAQGLF